jgi:hypothetical protein
MTVFTLRPLYSRNLLNKRFSVSDSLSPLFKEAVYLLPIHVQSPIMWSSIIICLWYQVPNLFMIKNCNSNRISYFSLINIIFLAQYRKRKYFVYHILSYSFDYILYQFMCGCMFCMLLSNFVKYVFLLLGYVFLLLCMFSSGYSVSVVILCIVCV